MYFGNKLPNYTKNSNRVNKSLNWIVSEKMVKKKFKI